MLFHAHGAIQCELGLENFLSFRWRLKLFREVQHDRTRLPRGPRANGPPPLLKVVVEFVGLSNRIFGVDEGIKGIDCVGRLVAEFQWDHDRWRDNLSARYDGALHIHMSLAVHVAIVVYNVGTNTHLKTL